MLKNKKAFTLIELLITMAVAGVLAAFAIPLYGGIQEQTRQKEADVDLMIIRTGEKVYALNDVNGNYWVGGALQPIDTVNTALNIDIATPVYYGLPSFTVNNSAVPKTFTVTFIRNSAGGGNGSSTRSIDKDGNITYT